MKTSSIVASVLFGSMAAAAPMLNKRAYVTHTSTLIQTEVTYTTVYADEPAAKPSASPAFFEKPTGKPANAPSAAPTQPAPVASVKPSSAVAPVKPSSQAPQQPAAPTVAPPKPSTPAPAPTVAPAQPSVEAVAPKPSTTPAAPAPAPSSTKPATPAATPATPATGGSGSGAVHSGGSMTIHPFGGALGSCGQPIADTDMTVALAVDLYGESTYDVATGNPTNKWCGQKINITYKGKTVPATIMDRCPGCTNGGLDVSKALWKTLTGTEQGDRLYGMTWTNA